MTRLLAVSFCALMALGLATGAMAGPKQSKPRKVLYVTLSKGYKHATIPLSEKTLKEIGERSKLFDVDVTQDVSAINSENLKKYDVVAFYTTGELPMDDSQKAALLDFVKSGKGFVGFHCATDTFYKWPEYGEMVGGYFDGHPWSQDVVFNVEDPKFPGAGTLGKSFKLKEEVYQYKDWSRDKVHVLVSMDNSSVDINKTGAKRADKDYAVAWTKPYGKGRVFFSGFGHYDVSWTDSRMQEFLLGGIKWAAGITKANMKLGTRVQASAKQ